MIAIIQQYIDSEWVELTRMPFDDHVKTDEQIEEALIALTTLIFENDKVKIRLKKEVVIFNRLDGPIKIIVEEFEEFDYSKTEE
jgi:hypothetical protein